MRTFPVATLNKNAEPPSAAAMTVALPYQMATCWWNCDAVCRPYRILAFEKSAGRGMHTSQTNVIC